MHAFADDSDGFYQARSAPGVSFVKRLSARGFTHLSESVRAGSESLLLSWTTALVLSVRRSGESPGLAECIKLVSDCCTGVVAIGLGRANLLVW